MKNPWLKKASDEVELQWYKEVLGDAIPLLARITGYTVEEIIDTARRANRIYKSRFGFTGDFKQETYLKTCLYQKYLRRDYESMVDETTTG
jgi:hypothetical protein